MILMTIYGVFLTIDCHFANYPIVDMLQVDALAETDILMALLDSVNGYNGLLKMLVLYTLPVLFGVYFLSYKEVSYVIVRYSIKEKFRQEEIKKIILVSVGFTILHQIISFIYVSSNISRELLMKYPFVLYTIVAGIIAILFYIQTGLLYHIISDYIKADLLAFVFMFCINFIQHILIKYRIVKFWISGSDFLVAFDFFEGKVSVSIIIFTIIRSIIVTVALYMISQMIFEKKDIMKYEK